MRSPVWQVLDWGRAGRDREEPLVAFRAAALPHIPFLPARLAGALLPSVDGVPGLGNQVPRG